MADEMIELDAGCLNWVFPPDDVDEVNENMDVDSTETFSLMIDEDSFNLLWDNGAMAFDKKEFLEALLTLLAARQDFDMTLAQTEYMRLGGIT